MKNDGRDIDKELYRRLRTLSADTLWNGDVARFDRASPPERLANVAVVRAVGVVFSETGSPAQRAAARAWLVGLLKDPQEKIRRYAMTALPKLGSGPVEEQALLALLRTSANEREKKFLGQALEKIGGVAALSVPEGAADLHPQTRLKIRAAVERRERPGSIRMAGVLSGLDGVRVHLRCRKGLEPIVLEEAAGRFGDGTRFRLLETAVRRVTLLPRAPFSLSDLYRLRCFATVGFPLGIVGSANPADAAEALAAAIVSPLSRRVLAAFTDGPVRYRLEFLGLGHRRGAIREVANRAYAMCPEILNDARRALWSVDVHPDPAGWSVELRPRLYPDPRWYYRVDDVPAASHPPLAACMARLSTSATLEDHPTSKQESGPAGCPTGRSVHLPQSAIRNPKSEIVWDPFCGSGQELVERALLGGVGRIVGTDLDERALAIARVNVAAAKLDRVGVSFACRDFRRPDGVEGLEPGRVTLIVTNPPMGRRIRIPDLKGLIGDLFDVATRMLAPGGRLVFPNPVRIGPRDARLRLEYRRPVDLGGFECRLEVYRKSDCRMPKSEGN